MSVHNWIDVRLGEKQELSPILVEHRPAYSIFDCQAFQPRIILSIRGVKKRHFYRTIGLGHKVPIDAGILLRPLQLATLILDSFESLRLVPTWKAASEFQCQTEESFALRDLAGYGFSSDHVKRFFQTAVLQFGQSTGQQIDFYQAVRFRNPLQHQLAERLIRFVSATKDIDLDYVTVIASALELDAHPPDMHCNSNRPTVPVCELSFPPAPYLREDLQVGVMLSGELFGKWISRKGLRKLYKVFHALAHLRLIERYRSAWRDCTASNVCFVCVVRSASITLGCKHRLCDACVVICGTRDSPASPDIRVMKCPLCGKRNGELILLQPPTGGNRVLELGGTSANKWTMIKFLKDLQSSIGLPLSLQEHFDLVVGSGIDYLSGGIELIGLSISPEEPQRP
ncbi:unnamed protein product [Fusarium graminearum]|uniref:RING-type domain-containing protein n=1 Tax=Gibberella zeae TaxID=5518 RepID=A0A9N8NCC4_GIBZA|nr:unnamed protein product [Fusarium graminearum]